MKQRTFSKLRELWAIRRRCREIETRRLGRDATAPRAFLPKSALICLAACFFFAAILHVRDVWRHGWLPYQAAPLPLNFYWTGLLVLDFAAAVLLLIKPRVGLVVSLLVVGSDLIADVFARWDLHLIQHGHGALLISMQLGFLAVLSAAGLYAISGGKLSA